MKSKLEIFQFFWQEQIKTHLTSTQKWIKWWEKNGQSSYLERCLQTGKIIAFLGGSSGKLGQRERQRVCLSVCACVCVCVCVRVAEESVVEVAGAQTRSSTGPQLVVVAGVCMCECVCVWCAYLVLAENPTTSLLFSLFLLFTFFAQ